MAPEKLDRHRVQALQEAAKESPNMHMNEQAIWIVELLDIARPPVWCVDDNGNETPQQISSRLRYNAYLMQLRGQYVKYPCDRCAQGSGPFQSCVVIPTFGRYGVYMGACACCVWHNRGRECSLRSRFETVGGLPWNATIHSRVMGAGGLRYALFSDPGSRGTIGFAPESGNSVLGRISCWEVEEDRAKEREPVVGSSSGRGNRERRASLGSTTVFPESSPKICKRVEELLKDIRSAKTTSEVGSSKRPAPFEADSSIRKKLKLDESPQEMLVVPREKYEMLVGVSLLFKHAMAELIIPLRELKPDLKPADDYLRDFSSCLAQFREAAEQLNPSVYGRMKEPTPIPEGIDPDTWDSFTPDIRRSILALKKASGDETE